ncbi:ABC transporter substrate-binding protein, partial [bacterium]
KGTEKATQEDPGIKVEFKLPGKGDVAEQKTILDDLIAKGVEGVAISPIDPANGTQMLNDAAGKTLLFTQDSDAPNSNRACYIGTDNVAAGKQAGEEIKKALPNGGTVIVFVGQKDAQNAKERYQGVQEALQGSNIKILDIRTDDTDRVKAKSNVSDALVKNPDLGCAVGLWSYNGPAIYNAVKESGKAGKVKIVCFDEESETLAGVTDGAISATIVQQPYEFGYQSVKTMAAYLRGDKSVIPASKKVIVPTLVVNKENVAEFTKKITELRK